MSFEYSYRFTEIATVDVSGIFRYIAEDLGNPSAATRFGQQLKKTLQQLCSFPKSGAPVRNEFLYDPDVRKVAVRNYVLYYGIDEENGQIIIYRVISGRRDQNGIVFPE